MGKSYFDLKPVSFRGKITVAAPSGIFNKQHFNAGITQIKLNKMKPWWDKDIYAKSGYTAGTADQRFNILLEAFRDSETEAIWAARGGFGAIHLLPMMDKHLEEIKNNPKLLIGFSDISILQSYLVEKCGFVAVHGPNVTTLSICDNYSKKQIMGLLQGEAEAFSIYSRNIYPVQEGTATGIVKGGNLASLASLIGTPWEPDFTDSILFLEDVGEVPYKIDRMLTQLRYAGKFDRLKGLILGDFSYREKNPPGNRFVNANMIVERMGIPAGIPVVSRFPAGHGKHNMAFLLGAVAKLDTDSKTLSYDFEN